MKHPNSILQHQENVIYMDYPPAFIFINTLSIAESLDHLGYPNTLSLPHTLYLNHGIIFYINMKMVIFCKNHYELELGVPRNTCVLPGLWTEKV